MKGINLITLVILLSINSLYGQYSKISSSFKVFKDGINIYHISSFAKKIQNEEYQVEIAYNVNPIQDNRSKLNLSFVSDKLNWTHSLKVDEFEHLTAIETDKKGTIGEFELNKIKNNLLLKFQLTLPDNDGVTHYFPFVYHLNLENLVGDLSLEERKQFELDLELGLRFFESVNKNDALTIKYCEFSKLGGNFSINDCPVVLEVNHKGTICKDTLNTGEFAKNLYLRSVTGLKVLTDGLFRRGAGVMPFT